MIPAYSLFYREKTGTLCHRGILHGAKKNWDLEVEMKVGTCWVAIFFVLPRERQRERRKQKSPKNSSFFGVDRWKEIVIILLLCIPPPPVLYYFLRRGGTSTRSAAEPCFPNACNFISVEFFFWK